MMTTEGPPIRPSTGANTAKTVPSVEPGGTWAGVNGPDSFVGDGDSSIGRERTILAPCQQFQFAAALPSAA